MMSKVIFWVTFGVSAALIVVGFLIPPTGVIDGSVLTAVGELFAFATLGQLPSLIQKGGDVSIKHNNT